ncbi:MAG: L-lactate dehydrogenase [Coriobacteriales bacterium]|nr:L-lactate dehydrogenase [Coriobacteriales bacterium]
MHQFGTRKVVVIGMGRVGSHVALSLMFHQLVDEIVLLDINQKAAHAQMVDLKDWASALDVHVKVRTGDYSDCSDARFIIMTAGRHRKPGETRLQMLDGTFTIMRDIVDPIRQSGFHGILISVSNPADVVAEYLYRELDLPRNHCFGSGTALDTFRMRRAVGNRIGLERSQVQAVVMGEHGDSSFIPTSHVYLAGVPLEEYVKMRPEHAELLDFDSVSEQVRDAGARIIAGKGATEFGIGGTVAEIVSSILHNEKRVIPLSAHLEGEYGEKDVSVGVPCLIGEDGIEHIYELDLAKEELSALHSSCEILRDSFSHIN